MSTGDRFLLFLKCLLPALLIAALSPLPGALAVQQGLRSARLAQAQGDHATAARALRAVADREPWRTGLWEQIGRLEVSAGAMADAVDALRRASVAGQLSAEGRYQLGEAYLALELPEDAWAAWNALLTGSAPQELRGQTYERLAQLARTQGDLPAARAVLRAWVAEAPENPRAAYQLGALLAVIEPDGALPPLLEASRLDSTYTPPVQALRRGLNLADGSENAAYGALVVGRALGSIGEWDLAGVSFQRALDLDAEYAEAWAFLSEAQHQQGQDGSAAMERALALNSQSTVVRALAAVYYRRLGDPARALEQLRAVALEEPQEPIWQVEIGNTLAQSGDLTAALAAFQAAADLAPQNTVYWQHLARFSIAYNYDLVGIGIPAARKAVILAPNDPAALDVMGLALLARGDWASAERFLQQAITSDAAYAPAALHLGMLYIEQNRPEQARPLLQRAASLAGAEPVGQTARRLLRQYFGE